MQLPIFEPANLHLKNQTYYMRGLLKSRRAFTQFILLVSIALVSFFVVGMIGTLILSAITGVPVTDLSDMSKLDFSKPGVLTFIRGMQVIQFISLFTIPVFICARLFSTDSRKYLGLKQPSNVGYYLAGIAVMLFAIPLVNWLGELNRNIQFPLPIEQWMKAREDEASHTIRALLSKHTIKDLLLNLVFIAVLAAVGEELLFRGIVQRLFIRIFASPVAGIILTAFLFSAMHMQFYGFLPRFMLGIVLGFVYWYSGSLWTVIIAHFVYDATLIILAYFNPEMITEETSVKLSNLGLAAAISFVVVCLIIGWMKSRSKTRYEAVYADDYVPVKDHPF